jgi:hypothetical protein
MAVMHLHWSRNPKLVRETTLGITVCGVKVPHDQLTAHLADTTCRACLAKSRLDHREQARHKISKIPSSRLPVDASIFL